MYLNTNFLFQYLEKEDIQIDKPEFIFQFQSHPNFPTLLAVSETLHFFDIDNFTIQLPVSEIELLPNHFIALLLDEKNEPQPHFVRKKGIDYLLTTDKWPSKISKQELEARWHGIVLLVEKPEIEESKPKQKFNFLLPLALLISFTILLFEIKADWQSKLFIAFPIVGLLFSVAAIKDLLGAKNGLINSFCNISTSTSCSAIVDSEKWKIFKLINFSDLSIIFFTTQFLGFFTFLLSGNLLAFFNINEILLWSSLPIIFLSIYFQKFVEKKWCPICLAIIAITIAELVYISLAFSFNFSISFSSLILFLPIFLFASYLWLRLKNILNEKKDLKEFKLKSNRFIRNYEMFKNNLVSSKRMKLVASPIILGNTASKTEITIITNPFCGYCKEAHKILDKILTANRNNLKIKVLINADIENIEEDKKTLFRGLMATYLEKGEHVFIEALSRWFANPKLKDWESAYESVADIEKIDSFFKVQNQWCIDNNSFLTPSIFINSHRYPKNYDREHLEFFINEIIEDSDFH